MENIQIAVLEARLNDGTLLWAEGCDPDGYSYHQVIIPISALSDDEKAKIGNPDAEYPWSYLRNYNDGSINLGETEANVCKRDYDKFKISMKYIDYK